MTEGELNPEGKKLLQERMRAHDRIEKAVQIVDVIEAFSSLTGNPSEEAKIIVSGSSQAKINFVLDVVKAYRQEKPSMSIKEFFNGRYESKAIVLLKPVDAIQEAIRTPERREEPKVEVTSEADVKTALAAERSQKLAESLGPKTQVSAKDFMDRESRTDFLAKLLSAFENVPAEVVKKTELDVMQRIMKITDQNPSLRVSDEDVFKACVALLSERNIETKFLLEALVEDNRDDLLKRATEVRKARSV